MSMALGKNALGARVRLSEGDWVQGSRSRGERAREGPCVGNRLVIRHVGPLLGSCQRPGIGARDGCHKVAGGESVFLLTGNLQGWDGEWRRLRSPLLPPSHRETWGQGARVCPWVGERHSSPGEKAAWSVAGC